jgi:membrane protein DedA with SNARE-associated domain/rhodanese-related sulfurtransferase
MRLPRYAIATAEMLLIFPAVLFMAALFLRNVQPLQYEPARTAQQIVTWYVGPPRLGLWGTSHRSAIDGAGQRLRHARAQMESCACAAARCATDPRGARSAVSDSNHRRSHIDCRRHPGNCRPASTDRLDSDSLRHQLEAASHESFRGSMRDHGSFNSVHALSSNITEHGYSILFALVFAEAVGLPVPAALALLVAGASSLKGPLHLGLVLLTSLSALLLGDALLFLLGRYTGWWLLGLLCKLSLNPDSCILRSAESFHRHGRTMLLIAKFVPGINTLAPPLAGSMNMRFVQFFALDVAGASLYAVVWCGMGFLCSDFLAPLTNGYQTGSRILLWLGASAIAIYFGYHIWLLLKAGALGYVPRVSASEVARRLYSDLLGDMAVFDVRSHGYYSRKAYRVKGSIRLEPNALLEQTERLPRDKEIVLYCSCHREATSLRVARILQQHGFRSSVMKGGLRAWRKGGFPLETVPPDDVVLLPSF